MHAEEEAGSIQTICTVYGLSLKVREGVPAEETALLKKHFQKFGEESYAKFKDAILFRLCQAIGVPKEVLEASQPGSFNQAHQAKPKRRSRRRARRR